MICGINPVCDETQNYCVVGACISKNTVYYGIAGIIGLVIIIRESSKK